MRRKAESPPDPSLWEVFRENPPGEKGGRKEKAGEENAVLVTRGRATWLISRNECFPGEELRRADGVRVRVTGYAAPFGPERAEMCVQRAEIIGKEEDGI